MITPRARLLMLGAALISGVLVAALPLPASAIESAGVGAVPANPRADNPRTSSIFVLSAEPGATVSDAVKVVNNGDKPKTIRVYAVDSQHSSDGAFACAQEADKKVKVGSWIKLVKESVTLGPGKSEVIKFSLTLPKDASPGEHNGCIAIQEDVPPKPSSTNGIVLSFRSALRVAVTVPGEVHANVDFLNILYSFAKEKVQLSPVLKNEGNISVDAKINVGLKDVFGRTVTQNGGQFALLSNEESRFNFEMDRPFWGWFYQKTGSADYIPLRDKPEANESRKVVQAKSEWVFVTPHPVALIIEVAVPLLMASGIFYLLWRRKQHQFFAMRSTMHTVKSGEDIQSLAKSAGVNWKLLAKLNSLKAPYTLTPGQKIKLPYARNAATHTKPKK